jgi:hypothetical protein
MQAKLGEHYWRCSNMPCIVIVANIVLNENNCLNQLVNHNDWPKWWNFNMSSVSKIKILYYYTYPTLTSYWGWLFDAQMWGVKVHGWSLECNLAMHPKIYYILKHIYCKNMMYIF